MLGHVPGHLHENALGSSLGHALGSGPGHVAEHILRIAHINSFRFLFGDGPSGYGPRQLLGNVTENLFGHAT